MPGERFAVTPKHPLHPGIWLTNLMLPLLLGPLLSTGAGAEEQTSKAVLAAWN